MMHHNPVKQKLQNYYQIISVLKNPKQVSLYQCIKVNLQRKKQGGYPKVPAQLLFDITQCFKYNVKHTILKAIIILLQV